MLTALSVGVFVVGEVACDRDDRVATDVHCNLLSSDSIRLTLHHQTIVAAVHPSPQPTYSQSIIIIQNNEEDMNRLHAHFNGYEQQCSIQELEFYEIYI